MGGTVETGGIHKGLDEDRPALVVMFPFTGQSGCRHGQDPGSEVPDPDPGENQETGVPDHQMEPPFPLFAVPADPVITGRQLQEDLHQERADNQENPEGKKQALKEIMADYDRQYGTTNDILNFDSYYQDVQKRIKDQQFPNRDLPHKGNEKIDITIVCDMLLTGFDAKYLNTLYIDKNLRYHGLIQAFSRTNRVHNSNKPRGNILDFRGQVERVDQAITLFSGVDLEKAREIWLVKEAYVVIGRYRAAVANLMEFLQSQGLEPTPKKVLNLRGDAACIQFINLFKVIWKLRTQLDQYTDLSESQSREIEEILSRDDLLDYQGAYLEFVHRLKVRPGEPGGGDITKPRAGGSGGQGTGAGGGRDTDEPEEELPDFELCLFASSDIDYDYIMNLIANYTTQDPKRVRISREQLIGIIRADAKFLDERETIIEYVTSLREGEGLAEKAVREGYERFKVEKQERKLRKIATDHGLEAEDLKVFVDTILGRMFFDGGQLTDLMTPLGLGWKERRTRELSLMVDLIPLLKRLAEGRDIPGLGAYERKGLK